MTITSEQHKGKEQSDFAEPYTFGFPKSEIFNYKPQTIILQLFRWNSCNGNDTLRETNCIRFGRNASLSACVLFAGGCVVGIAFVFSLDCSLQEVFLFSEWRTAYFLLLLDSCYCLLSTLCRGQLAPCTPRRAEPARPQLPAARILQPFFF